MYSSSAADSVAGYVQAASPQPSGFPAIAVSGHFEVSKYPRLPSGERMQRTHYGKMVVTVNFIEVSKCTATCQTTVSGSKEF
jgi:hypothetical protein